jgi:hypothetical protein
MKRQFALNYGRELSAVAGGKGSDGVTTSSTALELTMFDVTQSRPGVSPEVLLQIGVFQIQEGDFTNGEEVLREVVSRSPRNAEAWLWLARAAAQQRQGRTAERCFLQAYRCGHPDALRELTALTASAEAERSARRSVPPADKVSIEDRIFNAVVFNHAGLIALIGIVVIVIIIMIASSPFP